ncbi:4-hydroxy-2-oxoheptanedioate aldolase [Mesorhizobium sp. B2-4-9]|uniref:4-hydroxy-2-oxoheptanedioate aldolase n=1 Tax=Mesorhizobium sp. B2-4-9 TaxID=2589940 RepID=UPI00112A4867|nr:4-hydroxy-2-oxoheptanedioate aldolase [Mesorhizobium sp. B2-4-9]TPL21074.1 4-hydroxy-2-oxoheptanedioate aldolase [Mesorhizobium sp. B2-4-9]
MPAPRNAFKAALKAGQVQIGLWLGLANPYTAEIAAGAGFDWLVIDGEHGPNDIPLILGQLQCVAASGGRPVVRAVAGETWMIKQLLDIGAQTVLVPMVETPEQAMELVRATRYPPLGVRGVGAALARASAFNRIPDYLQTADDEICLLVQLETRAGLDRLEDIAAVDGVDGVFVGPSDLAADMGYLGRPGEPEVQAAVESALKRIIATGKPAGILTADQTLAARYLEIGATFVAVGTDVTIFSSSLSTLADKFKMEMRPGRQVFSSGY